MWAREALRCCRAPRSLSAVVSVGAEVDCVADGDRACVFGEHLIAPVVFHGRANVETFVAAVVP